MCRNAPPGLLSSGLARITRLVTVCLVVAYQLPFPLGTSALITQGNGDGLTHLPHHSSEYAWDFALPEGAVVTASAPGTVVSVKQSFQGGGLSDVYRSRANSVVLRHPDGRYSLYLHLAYRGALVEPGQEVAGGQGIGLSGATGYVSGPHLHFQVQERASVSNGHSLPVSFTDAGVPARGDLVVSANRLDPAAGGPVALTALLPWPAAAPSPPPDTLYTHQTLPLDLSLAPMQTPKTVRLVAARSSGERVVIVQGVLPAATVDEAGPSLRGSLELTEPGRLTLWAEYRDGSYWRTLPDERGRVVEVTHTVAQADILVAGPGVELLPDLPVDGASSSGLKRIRFTLVNRSGRAITVRQVTVASPDGPLEAPITPAVHLVPGGSYTWEGPVVTDPLRLVRLTPQARDASDELLVLPPLRLGDPTTVQTGAPPPPRPTSAAPPFSDVPAHSPQATAITLLADRGLVSGYPDGRGGWLFRPEEPIARAQFAKILVNALGLSVGEDDRCPFVDVEDSGLGGLYPDNYVAVAAQHGLVRGFSVDPPLFGPYRPVTRGQALAMMERAAPALTPVLPGDLWEPATRGEAAILLAAVAGS